MFDLAPQLRDLQERQLYRQLHEVEAIDGVVIRRHGRDLVEFASNDYLGLRQEPLVIAAAKAALEKFGSGSGASRLITGSLSAHQELERQLSNWWGIEAALMFESGYAAALGTIPALVGPPDAVVLDKLCHACLIDAARLSGATIRVFPHQNIARLDHLLASLSDHARRVLVVTESVFSMDGDFADLERLTEVCQRRGAALLVDEAHAIGVIGSEGDGLVEMLGLRDRVDIRLGTLSKALGSAGGFIAGNRQLIETLINRARSFIFSTAPPPAAAAGAGAALRFLQSPQGRRRRQRLQENIARLRSLIPVAGKRSADKRTAGGLCAILPVMIGQEAPAMAVAEKLLAAGFYVPAIRYPTVARGAARLRITVSALHSDEQIEAFGAALGSGLRAHSK
jgi:8-amino-7-oxononanoate synthase